MFFFGKFFPAGCACLALSIVAHRFPLVKNFFSEFFRELAVAVRRSFPYEFHSETLALALLGYHNVLRLSSTFFRFSKRTGTPVPVSPIIAPTFPLVKNFFHEFFSCNYRYPLFAWNQFTFQLQTLRKDAETMGNSHFSLICAL